MYRKVCTYFIINRSIILHGIVKMHGDKKEAKNRKRTQISQGQRVEC